MKQKAITDSERILLRKRIEAEEWMPRWRGKLSTREARLDLWRWYLRRGLVTLAEFQTFKRENEK